MRLGRSERNLPPAQPKDGVSVDLFEANTHSFIVKIWLEETAEEAGRATWRGHITHVPSGERRYLKDLNDIAAVIMPYLEGMDVKLNLRWRVGNELKRLGTYFGNVLRSR